MDLSVIVPAYNEEDNLAKTVHGIDELLRSHTTNEFEIIIVNDGSVDATHEKARALAATLQHCYLISYQHNQGKGYALRQGFAAARGNLVAFLDADGEIEPQMLLALLFHQQRTSATIVVGRKVALNSRPWHRQLMTSGIKCVSERLFQLPISDSQVGIKLFVKRDIQHLLSQCKETGYLFDLELLISAHQQRLVITEIPVAFQVLRPSRIGLGSGFGSLGTTLKLFLRWRAQRVALRAGIPLRTPPTTNPQRLGTLTTLAAQDDSYDVCP